jgi:hypothetical protein
MKNFFLIIALSTFTLLGKAQGNLQFSQAKLVNTIDTVPSGKVWKIESIIYSSSIVDVTNNPYGAYSGCFSNSISDNIIINGNSVTVRKSSSVACSNVGASSLLWEQKLPIWLNQGNTISSSSGVLYINVLEFNISP